MKPMFHDNIVMSSEKIRSKNMLQHFLEVSNIHLNRDTYMYEVWIYDLYIY